MEDTLLALIGMAIFGVFIYFLSSVLIDLNVSGFNAFGFSAIVALIVFLNFSIQVSLKEMISVVLSRNK